MHHDPIWWVFFAIFVAGGLILFGFPIAHVSVMIVWEAAGRQFNRLRKKGKLSGF